MTGFEFMIENDDLWPRELLYRYRIYVWRPDGHEVIAATPTMGGVGAALLALHEDAKRVGETLADRGRIGVLDVMPDRDGSSETGEWIVLPFDRGDHV